MGVKSAAVDAMIAAVLRARTRPDLVDAVRALDRVLVSGSYVSRCFIFPINGWRGGTTIRHPARTSLFGYLPETWWRQRATLQ